MLKNPELDLARKFVQYTNRNIFLTGKAGTGKTTFLKSLKQITPKRMVIVAPTGVAAINAGGVTVHSFFRLPFGPVLTEKVAGHVINNPNFNQKFNKQKINILKTLDLLVIDEISMVRADILDAIDEILRRFKNRFSPFGGVQLLMIGDMQQLAPVIKNDELQILSPYYKSVYFFNSKALAEADLLNIELKHIYRQNDQTFINILNEIRNDTLSENSYHLLRQRYIPDFKPPDKSAYITLTTHNNSANIINEEKLKEIKGKSHKFKAVVQGNFSDYAYPTDFELELKKGAQVMFVKNDSSAEKRYFNGKIGVINGFEENTIIVKCEGEDDLIHTGTETWETVKYNLNKDTNEIESEFIGSFTQYPLRLAWAITIHKSQGLSFDKAVIDAAAAFAHGQTYVALSRCKTLNGLVLSSMISEKSIICDKEILSFNNDAEKNQPNETEFKKSKLNYQIQLLNELFNYKQLTYRFNLTEKKLNEYSGTYTGNLGDTILIINKQILPKLSSLAVNFMKQVSALLNENPEIEKNNLLQERLKKAAEYFIQFHENEIIKKIEFSSFETDNKVVKNTINENISSVNEILRVKRNGLTVCLTDFKIQSFLDAQIKALLEEEKKPKPKLKNVETEHPGLYAELKKWRENIAEFNDIELYMVLPNKTLQEIANKLPVSEKELKAIKGIGKNKFDNFGNEIIKLVLNFVEVNNLEPNKDAINFDKPEKTLKKKNWELTYELYNSGKTIAEIADIQKFTIQTIENHLIRFIETGEVNINELVDSETIKTITDYYKKKPESNLSEAKNSLTDKITYSQIKLVKAYINFLESV